MGVTRSERHQMCKNKRTEETQQVQDVTEPSIQSLNTSDAQIWWLDDRLSSGQGKRVISIYSKEKALLSFGAGHDADWPDTC